MQLPTFLKRQNKKGEKKEYFFALLISNETVQAAVWTIKGEVVDIVGKSTASHDDNWDNIIEAADIALSNCTQSLANDADIDRVVFGLSSQHVKGEKISSEYLKGLKRLSKELSLSPSGFVVIPEALAYLLEKREGSPPTVILLGVERSNLTVSVFSAGKAIGTITVPRSEQIAQDVDEALRSFKDIEILPAKILIYNGEKSLRQIQQKLLDYPWEKNKSFLHFPKIDTINKDRAIDAVILAGAGELLEEKELKSIVDEPSDTVEKLSKGEEKYKKEDEQDKEEETSVLDATRFGFVKDKDVAQSHEHEIKKDYEKRPRMEVVVTEEKEKKRTNLLPRMPLHFPHLKLSLSTKWLADKRILILTALFTLFLIGGMTVLAYWTYPKAKVTILVDPQSLTREVTIVLDPKISKINQIEGHIPARFIDVEVEGTKTITTTGNKITGEPAQGEVTIYNKTTDEKAFPKGTVLVGPKSLKFTLDNQVTVASMSDVIVGTPGKEIVSVTASNIGSESNLPAGSDFSFKDFPLTSYAARNEKAFKGGTSRQVQAVAKEDKVELLDLLTQELENNARSQLTNRLNEGEELLDKLTKMTVLKKSFSHDLGDEAKELTMNASFRITGIAFQRKDIIQVVKEQFTEAMPPNYSFNEKDIKIDIVETTPVDEKLKATFYVTAKTSPSIEIDPIRKALTGRTLEETDRQLKETKGIVGYEIKFSNKLPFGPKRLPYLMSNLTMEVRPR